MTDPVLRRDPFRLVGALLDGRFRVEREVAEGGFGVVYYAIQVALERPVALKVLKTPSGMDTGARTHFRDKFAAEAKTIARIRHPHIVDVHDFGISKMPSGEEAPWMALEWLRGKTLDEYLVARRGEGGQSPAQVLTLLRPVLRAFAYAHKEGIAHRDIKPANIMVVSTESGGSTTDQGSLLRVLDFGIAKLMDSDENAGTGQTRTAGMPAFSPPYAAPEQVAFGRTGPWTDVHALGLILTEMLVDQPPYQEQNMQLFEEVMATKRPTPQARGRNVGPWEAVIAKALALSPGERWKGAGELLSALETNVNAATVAASAPSRPRAVSRRALPRKAPSSSSDVGRLPAAADHGVIPFAGRLEVRRYWRSILVATAIVIGLSLGIGFTVSYRRSQQGKPSTAVTNMLGRRSPSVASTRLNSINSAEIRPPVVVPVAQPSPPTQPPSPGTDHATSGPSIGDRVSTPSRPKPPVGASQDEPSIENPASDPRNGHPRPKGVKHPEASHRHAPKIEIE